MLRVDLGLSAKDCPLALGIAATLWQHAAHWRHGANFAPGWRPTLVMRTPSEQQRLAAHHGDEG
eukprot:scaffold32310_cov36-Phaeocystis_antarctica.AAC.1